MSRCRHTDTIAAIVADPALGVDALTDDQWTHIGICGDCHPTVRGLQALDRSLTAALRSMRHEGLPASILDTPAVPRGRSEAPFGAMVAAAAVVIVAIGIATFGSQWLTTRGAGLGTDPSPSAATPAPSTGPTAAPTSSPTADPSATPTPTVEPSPAPTTRPEPIDLAVGQVASVVDEPLVVRTAPGTDPDSTITPDRLWIGQRVRILDGPADVDGYTWWEVEVGEIRGWVADAEADDSAPWLAPLAGGRIHFWRYPGEGNVERTPELYSIRPDGTDERAIGDPTAAELRLVISCGVGVSALDWTHDGRWAAFDHSPGGCDREVYVMSADAGDVRKVGDGWGPAWRPDGEVLAFAPNAPYLAVPEEGAGEIREVGLAGTSRQLTDSGTRLSAAWPAWSPNRRQIAYMGSAAPPAGAVEAWTYEIYVADADGADARVIGEGMRPLWSPDGRWIVVELPADDGTTTMLWRMRPDGSDLELLGEGWMAEFSPDGRRLAVVRSEGVYTMPGDGGDASLAIGATVVDGVAWSPDGSSLLVSSNHASELTVGISIVHLDGAAPAITGLVTPGHAPSWQPLVLDRRVAD